MIRNIHYKALDILHDQVICIDKNENITYFNRSAEKKYNLKDALGKNIDDFYECGWVKGYDKTIALNSLKKTGSWFGENIHILKNGKKIIVESNVSVLKDKQGRPAGMLAIIHDITQRKEMEKKLNSSEERYKSVVEAQIDLICRAKPDGTLTFVNRAYAEYYGKTPKQLIGKKYYAHIPEGDTCKDLTHINSLAPHAPTKTIEHRTIIPSGEIRWQRWTDIGIFDKDGTLVEVQSIGSDITDRKQAETDILEKNKELERFNKAMVGRELRMVELKKQINSLLAKLGEPKEYLLDGKDG